MGTLLKIDISWYSVDTEIDSNFFCLVVKYCNLSIQINYISNTLTVGINTVFDSSIHRENHQIIWWNCYSFRWLNRWNVTSTYKFVALIMQKCEDFFRMSVYTDSVDEARWVWMFLRWPSRATPRLSLFISSDGWTINSFCRDEPGLTGHPSLRMEGYNIF